MTQTFRLLWVPLYVITPFPNQTLFGIPSLDCHYIENLKKVCYLLTFEWIETSWIAISLSWGSPSLTHPGRLPFINPELFSQISRKSGMFQSELLPLFTLISSLPVMPLDAAPLVTSRQWAIDRHLLCWWDFRLFDVEVAFSFPVTCLPSGKNGPKI